jgi:uncharacterized membrane protein YheB (UPF0754 family)
LDTTDKKNKSAKAYFREHFPFEQLLGGENEVIEEGTSSFNQQQLGSTSQKIILMLLKISPWLCGAGLLIALGMSFGFPYINMALEDTFHLFGDEFTYAQLQNLVKNVTVGGLIGYGTNYLAIRMLFRPVEKRPLLGQGLIPAQKDIIIDTLAGGIQKHVLNPSLILQRVEESGLIKKLNDILIQGSESLLRDEELRAAIKHYLFENLMDYFQKEEVRDELRDLIDKQVEKKADKGLKKWVLSTYKRVNREDYDALINQVIMDIPEGTMDVIARLEAEIDEGISYIKKQKRASELYMTRFIMQLLNKIDIKGILANQMKHFDERKLERMVWEATNEQLLYIQYLGTILGMLGGLIIWNENMVWIYMIAMGVIFGLDNLIYRLKKKKIE